MVFYKSVQVNELKLKYGETHKGLVAREPIGRGELIWSCECAAKDASFTRAQLLALIAAHPRLNYFLRSFSYMVDDDLYALPLRFMDEQNNDECALFNHSCEPNCGFSHAYADHVVAIRDIAAGDELTYHYGTLETEASLIAGLKCMCGAPSCCGRLSFDFYRDPGFVALYYDCMTPYLKQKVVDNRERWCSASCFVKRFPPNESDGIVVDEWPKGLCALRAIREGELVAVFASDEVAIDKHFLRHSSSPNCEVVGGREVVAMTDIPAEAELTLYYHGTLL